MLSVTPTPVELIDDDTATRYYNEFDTLEGAERESRAEALRLWADQKDADQKREQFDTLNKIYSDFDGYVNDAGLQDFDEDSRYNIANRQFIASQFDQTPEEQQDIYSSFRDKWTESVVGKKGMSEKETFDLIKQGMDARNEVSEAANQIPGDIALSLFDSIGGNDPVDVPKLIETWKTKNADSIKKLPPGWEAPLLESAQAFHTETEGMLRDYAEPLKKVYDHLAAVTGRDTERAGETNPKNQEEMDSMVDTLASMPKPVRERAYASVVLGAQKAGQDPKKFMEQWGESWSRTLNMVRTGALTAQEMAAESDLRMLEDKTSPPDYYISKSTGEKIPLANRAFYDEADLRKVTPEEIAAEANQARQKVKRFEVVRELQSVADNQFDPIEKINKGGFLGFMEAMAYGSPQGLAYTATALVPVVGPYIAGAAMFSDEYNQLRQQGMSVDQAVQIGSVSAAVQAGFERTGAKAIFGKLPAFEKLMRQIGNPARVGKAGSAGVRFLAAATGEQFVEGAQDLTTPLVQDVSEALGADVPDVKWQPILEKWGGSRLDVLAASLPTILLGTGVATFADNKRFEQFEERQDRYRMVGMDDATIKKIEDGKDLAEKQQNFQSEFGKLTPENVKAGIAYMEGKIASAQDQQQDPNTHTLTRETLADGSKKFVIRDPKGDVRYTTSDEQTAQIALSELLRNQITGTTRGIFESISFFNQMNEAAGRGEDVQKFLLSNAPRNLLTDYEANPTEQNLNNLFETVRAFGQDISEPAELANFPVLASNQGVLAEGIFKSVIQIHEGATGDKVVRDVAQDNLKRAIAEGRIKMEWVRENLNQIIPQIDSKRITGYRLRTETDTDVIESFSDVALAYMVGDVREEQIPEGFRGFLRRMAIIVKDIYRRAYNLKRLIADGKVDANFETLLADSVGLNQQARVDTASNRVSKDIITDGGQMLMDFSIGSRTNAVSTDTPSIRASNATISGPANYSIGAFHGTPHKVDKFSTAKIGTGEGAQAYGWGLYFAEEKQVAITYRGGENFQSVYININDEWKSIGSSDVDVIVAMDVAKRDWDWDAGQKNIEGWLKLYLKNKKINEDSTAGNLIRSTISRYKNQLEAIKTLRNKYNDGKLEVKTTGNLYTVELDVDDADLLDWDMPLSGQSEKVKGAFNLKIWNEDRFKITDLDGIDNILSKDATLGEAYQLMGEPKDVSLHLLAAGIPGIRYLDGSSRSEGIGTYNYVVFDENLIRITEENGNRIPASQALAAPATGATNYSIGKKDSLRVKMTRTALTDAALNQASWKDWYEEHQSTLDEFFGDHAQLFQDILSVTSQAASVKANVGLALKAFGQMHRGEEFSGFLPAVIKNLNRLRENTQVQGQKISAYKNSNDGKVDEAVIDRHIARLIFGVDSPSKAQFAKAQKILTEIANEIGWTPRQVQAALWAHSIYKSGKTPESYGAYLKKLESRGTLAERIGDIGSRGGTSNADGRGRGRFAPESTADGAGVNYSIASQSEIDRVNKALGGMNRGPDERLKVYQRAKQKFSKVMAWNSDELAAMADTGSDETQIRRNQLLQGFGELDAILKVLPPEVRGRVGGYTVLANIAPMDVFKDGVKVSEAKNMDGAIISAWMKEGQNIGQAGKQVSLPPGYTAKENLASKRADKALADFFRDRIKKIDTELEKVLAREYRTAIEKVLEKALPKKSKAGVLTSTLGPEAAAFVKKAYAASLLDQDAATDRLQEIQGRLEEETDQKKVQELAEEWAVVNLFGAIDSNHSTKLASALDVLKSTIKAGRQKWKIQQDARREEIKKMVQTGLDTLGEFTSEQVNVKAKQERQSALRNLKDSYNRSLAPYQLLETIFGAEHPITIHFSRKMREATNDKNLRDIEARRKFEDAARVALGFQPGERGMKVRWAIDKALLGLLEDKKGVKAFSGRRVKAVRIPVEIAEKVVRGEINLKLAKNMALDEFEEGIVTMTGSQMPRLTDAHIEAIRQELASYNERLAEADSERFAEDPNATPARRPKYISIDLVVKEGVLGERTMNAWEAMQYLATWNQPDGRAHMERNGFTEESVKQMQQLASSPFAKAIYNEILKFYADNYSDHNRVFVNLYGVDMPKNINHSPLRFETQEKEQGGMRLPGERTGSGGMMPGHIKSRTKHQAELAQANMAEVFWNHVENGNYWIAWAQSVRDMRAVLLNPNLMKSVTAVYGEDAATQIRDMVTLFTEGGVQMKNRAYERIYNNIVSAVSTASLGFRLSSIVNQNDAGLRFMLKLSPKQQSRALVSLMQGNFVEKYKRALQSDTVQIRLAKGVSPLVRMMNENSNLPVNTQLPDLIKKFLPEKLAQSATEGMQNFMLAVHMLREQGFMPMQLTDTALTSFSAAVVYENAYLEAKDAGMPDAAAKQAALDAMDDAVFRTAQPVDMAQRSMTENMALTWQRGLMQFMSDQRLKFSMWGSALSGLAKGEGDRTQHLQTLVVLGFMGIVSETLRAWYRDFFTDDDDEEIYKPSNWIRAFLVGPLTGFWWYGTILDTMLRGFLGERTFGMAGQLDSFLKDIERISRNPEPLYDWSDESRSLGAWKAAARVAGGLYAPAQVISLPLNIVEPVLGASENIQTED
jgi:hypothetical protein